MTRLVTEGLSSTATLRIRAVSMLMILLMTMFTPAQARADFCESVCPDRLDIGECIEDNDPFDETGVAELCVQGGWGQSCQYEADVNCASFCGQHYTKQCVQEQSVHCESGYWVHCQVE